MQACLEGKNPTSFLEPDSIHIYLEVSPATLNEIIRYRIAILGYNGPDCEWSRLTWISIYVTIFNADLCPLFVRVGDERKKEED